MTWELPIRGFYSPSIELFRGDNFLQWTNQGPKNTADKGFSLWHSLSRDMHMFAHIDLELPQTHFQGLPIDISKAYCCNLYLKFIDIFLCVGNSWTNLLIARLTDSTNIATFVGIVILVLGLWKHQLIDFTRNSQ